MPLSEFSHHAPSAAAVFYRSYSRRKENGTRESFNESMIRTVNDISDIGKLTKEQREQALYMGLSRHCFPSGRALWVAGTEWAKKADNFPGYYNCCSLKVDETLTFGMLMELAMMGTGTGAVLETTIINKLSPVKRRLHVREVIQNRKSKGGIENTSIALVDIQNEQPVIQVQVGDSRQGWASAFQGLIELAIGKQANGEGKDTVAVDAVIILDLSQVRLAGEPLRGFGGTANPVRLQETMERACSILSKAAGRRLKSVEVCLLIDEAASAVVAGNIRRSAGMRQFTSTDIEGANAKDGLYKQDKNGKWTVDPEKDSLRLANHTRCYHKKPSYEDVLNAVTKQYWSGEGAIQYVPEMIARANVDLLNTVEMKKKFLRIYEINGRKDAALFLRELAKEAGEPTDARIINHRIDRYGLNPCGEIAMCDNLCNLSEIHLNTISPTDIALQNKAFYTGGIQVAALLQHKFVQERLQYSRENDPIVGVSFTGMFDFFVHAFGAQWLEWMMNGRPDGVSCDIFTKKEKEFLTRWRAEAERGVRDYCMQKGIRIPNRFTTVQPAGSKSLLTGASPGWHPPKAQRFIRRITFDIKDPLVKALREYGYSVVPAQSAHDEKGNLLDDIDDPRVREVLVEIPTEVSWANIPGCDTFDLSKLPVTAQWGLYMQVQNFYTTHNTSATLEYRENEIETLSKLIYDNIQEDGGYVSAALLARFDASETFPRLPFEPITKATYELMMNSVMATKKRSKFGDNVTVLDILKKYDSEKFELKGAAGCDSDKCLIQLPTRHTGSKYKKIHRQSMLGNAFAECKA